MTNSKHTPGPWYYVTGAAWTTPQGPDDGGQCVATRASAATIDPSQKDANLRLCASAPDLLAALEQALPIIAAYRRVSGGDGVITAALAHAAIRRAKGE